MANVKISDLTDGSPIVSGDLIEIERPGSPSVSRKAELGSAAGADIEDFATAAQGALADTAVQPSDLATVATTGDYDDLTNKPDLGDAAFLDVGTGAGDVAAGNHTHSNATTSVAGFMSASDKAKLDGIASGATANTGTVTSVGISVPTGLSASGGPITTSGTLTLTWSTGYQGYTTAEATKVGYLTVTSAVDLDAVAALASNALPKSGGELTGKVVFPASSGSSSCFKLVPGSHPSSVNLSNGDVWLTANGLFVRLNSQTQEVLFGTRADQTITGGAHVTSLDLGTITSGTVTPDPGDRPMQHYTNGGAHTLAPGSNPGTYVLDIVNNSSAGAITVSGWTKVAGDPFTTNGGDAFRCHCSVGNAGSLIVVQAMQ